MLIALREMLQKRSFPIKLIYLVYGALFYSCILLGYFFWNKPNRNIFSQPKPEERAVIFNGFSMNLVVTTPEEAREIDDVLVSGLSLEDNRHQAAAGNRAIAYLLAIYYFQEVAKKSNQVILTNKADNDAINSSFATGFLFLSLSASLGFSPAYYLFFSLYSGLFGKHDYDDYLSTIYYLCWAITNNVTEALEQSKRRIMYHYGLQAWEDIEKQVRYKIELAQINRKRLFQSFDKRSLVKELYEGFGNITREDIALKNKFWKTYKLKDFNNA